MTADTTPIGLIAGAGALPGLVARGAKAAGRPVIAVGLAGMYDPALPALCDRFRAAPLLRPGRWIRLLRAGGACEAVMVGAVRKQTMHESRLRMLLGNIPDRRALRLWYRRLRHDRRNATVLAALAEELARSGITLIDSTMYIPDHLATPGVMGSIEPAAPQQADIDFAWPLLSRAVELDIGQSMAVRERDIIAVEAVEGTARMIARAGELCRSPGWTLLKTAKADHDTRADVPSIGVETIEQVKAAGGRCIALGTGRVILIDKPAVIDAANRAGVALVGIA